MPALQDSINAVRVAAEAADRIKEQDRQRGTDAVLRLADALLDDRL